LFRISVIIPTYNRLGQLKKVLSGLGEQTYPRDEFEVLVISDGSSDGTNAYLSRVNYNFHLRAFFQSNQGAAAARNLGVAFAMGEIVLFIDDDVFPLPELIDEHLRYHATYGDNAVIIGPMLAPHDFDMSPWVRWESERLAEQYRDMSAGKWAPTARQFYTGNSSVARHQLIKSGGFDPSFRRAEDIELAYRLASQGLNFYFNPHAVVYHYAIRSFSSWIATPYSYGQNDVIFWRQKGQAWLLQMLLSEFQQRHVLIRLLISLCLSRPTMSNAVLDLFRRIALLGDKLNLHKISSLACGGMFNLQHYQGIADQLGGRQAFFEQDTNVA
jgi:GT2 family glycosyltransferase